jgi:transcriptional regulator with GAF, ATPase, and Fis domain
MSVVDEVSQALGLAGGLRQRIEAVLEVLERRFDVVRAVVYAVDATARQLEIVACHGLAAVHYRPRFGAGVVGRAAHSQQRIVVPEVRLEPMALSELTHPDEWSDEGWSQAAVPLLAGKALTGVLSCYGRGGPGAPLAGVADFSTIAALLARALERTPEPSSDDAPAPSARPRPRESVFEYANLVGASPAMRLIYEEISSPAPSTTTPTVRRTP